MAKARLAPKESWSDAQPFNRMLVKIKKEIIAFGVDGVDPARDPAPRIGSFRGFPGAVRRPPADLKQATVVTFCTGGIRCEKAAPFLRREGFGEVYQLDGGILKYFEERGGAHYEGECFVFDKRVGVDPRLRETSTVMCFACRMPLAEAGRRDPRYVPGVSCPHCAD